MLLERERELAAIGDVLSAARSGAGGLLVVEGPAGIGKTSLLREARRIAASSGMTVLHGVGTEFEREYPFGVVRQALAHRVAGEDARRRLLAGAARLAEPALLDTAGVQASPFGILNGLYWLLAGLAEEGPVLVSVDDAQWADDSSLRFLGFLSRRAESIPVAILVGARTPADFSAPPAALAEVTDHARSHDTRLEPRALGEPGVAELLNELDRGPADAAFVSACHRATGGNPFLLNELLRALRDSDSALAASEAPRIGDLSPPAVTRSINATLERLGPDASALARAVAILGEGTTEELAATLAGVARDAAPAIAAELVRAGILHDSAALRFRHPILAGAVRDGMLVHDRAADHARAAALLRDRGEPVERVALQLLHVPASADTRVADELRLAARHASDRGAPATAVTLVGRALAEPPRAADRPELLIELGQAESGAGRLVEASDHFAEAYRAASDPLVRGRAAAMMAAAVPGDPAARRRVVDLVRATIGEVERLDRELGLRLRSILVLEGEPVDDGALAGDTVAEAVVLGTLVFARMDPSARAAEIGAIASRAARQADALLEEGAIALAFAGIVLGLRWADRLEEAERLLDRAIDVARRRGAIADYAMAMTLRANVHRRAGRLREAEADARAALPARLDDHWSFARGVQPLAGALLGQGRTEEAAAELDAVVHEDIPDSPPMLPVVLTRMAVRHARREHERALADWHDAISRAQHGPNAAWIEDLAVAADVHYALGEGDAARATADQAMALAERWGTPGALGEALHAQARVGAVADPLDALREAASQLSRSPARLEHAKALVSLGAHLRRRGRRAAGREPLREGYELALSCGADALAQTASAELRASGVRVRREVRTGVAALTPSERRIADMAAGGLSNAAIAQELFLTVKTVEMHLTQAYRKLDVGGRGELATALGVQV